MNTIDTNALQDFTPSTEEEIEACYAVGRMCFERDDFRRAADIFRFITLTDPTNRKAWWGLAGCHEALEDFTVAAGLYEIGFRLGGESFDLGWLSARAWLQAGEKEEADRVLDFLDEYDFGAEQHERLAELRRQI